MPSKVTGTLETTFTRKDEGNTPTDTDGLSVPVHHPQFAGAQSGNQTPYEKDVFDLARSEMEWRAKVLRLQHWLDKYPSKYGLLLLQANKTQSVHCSLFASYSKQRCNPSPLREHHNRFRICSKNANARYGECVMRGQSPAPMQIPIWLSFVLSNASNRGKATVTHPPKWRSSSSCRCRCICQLHFSFRYA